MLVSVGGGKEMGAGVGCWSVHFRIQYKNRKHFLFPLPLPSMETKGGDKFALIAKVETLREAKATTLRKV